MYPNAMKMRQAAEKLGKHENTVRNWAEWYAEFLSPAPAKGEARFFTDEDLRVFAYVNELGSKGLGRQAIQDALREKFESNMPLPPIPPDVLVDPEEQKNQALILAETRTELAEAKMQLSLKDASIRELTATVNELREQVQYLRTAQEQERAAFTERINSLMDHYMDRYIAQADRVGDKYSGEVARLRQEIGQLRQQVQDGTEDETKHREEIDRLNRIIEDLTRRLKQSPKGSTGDE